MSSKTGRFRRSDRILSSRDFRGVVGRGERLASHGFIVFVAPPVSRGSERRRLGITVSRRVGNAVVRNRVKRSVREWFRRTRHTLPASAEVVVIARPAARELSGPAMASALTEVVGRP